jgi:hypothetical protein
VTHIVKVTGVLPQSVADHFAGHAERLYRWEPAVAVVEFTPVERMEPRPDLDDKAGSVLVRMTGIEIASGAQEQHLREAMRALYRIRTATGTIDEHLAGDHERALELTGAVLLGDADDKATS